MISKLNKSKRNILPWLAGAKLFLVMLAAISITVSSCDESSVIGLDIQPPNDLLNANFEDTTTVVAKTVKMDSLLSDQNVPILRNTGNMLLGTYVDPIVGTTSASIYTQLSLSTNNPGFGSSPHVDSVILCMVYDPAYYGKTDMASQTISVYTLTSDISTSTYYYSTDSIAADFSQDLANGYTFKPHVLDSVVIPNELPSAVLNPQVRVPLSITGPSGSIWQTMVDQNTTVMVSSSSLQAFMKGLFITTKHSSFTTPGMGNIMTFRMTDLQSRVRIYYHNDESPTLGSLQYDFSLAGLGRFSHVDHDYTSVDGALSAQLSSSPPSQNDRIFIQGGSGLKAKIEFPYIMDWLKAGSIGINKADLVLKIDQDPLFQKDTFSVPITLALFGVNADTTNFTMPFMSGDPGLGGDYDASTQEYHFNITRYIEEVLIGKIPNNGLNLLVANGIYNPNRVVVGGGASTSQYRMKLNITYTKLE